MGRSQKALDIAREVKSPLDEARALEGASRCTERTGDREAGLAYLHEAVTIYHRIGAAEAGAAAAYLATLLERPDEKGRPHHEGETGPDQSEV